MRGTALGVLLSLPAGCAEPVVQRAPPRSTTLLRTQSRVGAPCVLVQSFVNFSNVKGAATAASARLTVELDANPAYEALNGEDIAEFLGDRGRLEESVFVGETALEIGRLVGANAVLFGSLGGAWRGNASAESALLLDARLVRVGSREIVWADSRVLRPAVGREAQDATAAVQIAASDLAQALLASVPSGRPAGLRTCFEPLTQARLMGMPGASQTAVAIADTPSPRPGAGGDGPRAPSPTPAQPTAASRPIAPATAPVPATPAAVSSAVTLAPAPAPRPAPAPVPSPVPAVDPRPVPAAAARRDKVRRRRAKKKGRKRTAARRKARSARSPLTEEQARLAALYQDDTKNEASVQELVKGDQAGGPDTSTLASSDLQRVVETNRRDVAWCAEIASLAGADVRGKLRIRVRVDGNGRVVNTRVVSTTMDDQAVAQCVQRRMRAWTFPAPTGGSRSFVLPFVI